jgi:hypothetical protein
MRVHPQGRPYVTINESALKMAVDYAVGRIDKLGYAKAVDEMEALIETAISIDRERFTRKNDTYNI